MRALKVLSEREVTPQLGLLKSTLLQLDSTFSEREYGASSFRDFMEKVAQTGAVELKHAGRSMLVEAVSGAAEAAAAAAPAPVQAESLVVVGEPVPASGNGLRHDVEADSEDEDERLPQSPMSMQDGIKTVQHAFSAAGPSMRWPMYVRQARQFLRTAVPGFDERKYGFASVVDLLRAAGKEGVFRIERDRQGAVRVFPGANLVPKAASMEGLPVDIDETIDIEVPTELMADAAGALDQPSVEGTVDQGALPDEPMTARADIENDRPDEDEEVDDDGPQPGNSIHAPVSHGRKTKAAAPARGRAPRAPRAPRAAAKTPAPARPRARKSTK
jgi:hypothetical protein